MAARNLTPQPLAVGDLPPATAASIRAQATACGLDHDPLAGTTHGLRTDEDTLGRAPGGRGLQTLRRTVEALLTPELLIVCEREDTDLGDLELDPTARVRFHRLADLELAAPPVGMQRRRHGDPPAAPKDALTITGTPIGGTRRATRHIPSGSGPDVERFREALRTAIENAGP